jgi:exosortase B
MKSNVLQGRRYFFRLVVFVLLSYSFVFYRLINNEWSDPDSSYSPLILLLALWLLYRKWDDQRVSEVVGKRRVALLVPLLVLALVMFFFGTIGEITQLSYGSIVPLVLAFVVLYQKPCAAALPGALFLLFSIPLPLFIVVPVTQPMKQFVAAATESLLYFMHYPIARAGVILYMGPYQLQVADACAGLRTLFSLEAIGLMYLNLVEFKSLTRNIGMALLVFPIAMIANIVRVLLLCLITYYFGDAAGQGFLHEFTGITLFVCALLLLLGADAAFRSSVTRYRAKTGAAPT